jgi:MFS family permease
MAKEKLWKDLNLRIVFGITLMAVLGVASVAPALPIIKERFQISEQQVGMVIIIFTLPGIILTPLLGILADILGRKRIVVVSLFIFSLSGLACAIVEDFGWLIVFRFIQGMGTAGLGSLNVTLIGDLFSGKERSKAMGYNSSVLSVGTGIYPAIGGVLAAIGWHYPFLLSVLGLPIGLITLKKLKNPEPPRQKHIKAYLITAINKLNDKDAISIFTLTLIAFIIIYGSILVYTPFLLAERFNASSTVIGVMLSLASFATAITSAQSGRLSEMFRSKIILRMGFTLYIVSMLMIPFINNLWLLSVPVILFGAGQGINIPVIYATVASLAPMQQRAVFMAINGTILRAGQTLGPLIIGWVFGLWGIDFTFYASAGFAFIGLLINFVFLRNEKFY